MDSKKLLEQLRALTKLEEAEEEKEVSLKDAIDDEDQFIDMEDEGENLEDDEEYWQDDEEDENEEGIDINADGEIDNIHALGILKHNYNSIDDGMKHIMLSFARAIVDNSIDQPTLKAFLDEVDSMDSFEENPEELEDIEADLEDIEDAEEYDDLEDAEEYDDLDDLDDLEFSNPKKEAYDDEEMSLEQAIKLYKAQGFLDLSDDMDKKAKEVLYDHDYTIKCNSRNMCYCPELEKLMSHESIDESYSTDDYMDDMILDNLSINPNNG